MVKVVEILFESISVWTKFNLRVYLTIMFQDDFWFFVSWNRQFICMQSEVVTAKGAKVYCFPIFQHMYFYSFRSLGEGLYQFQTLLKEKRTFSDIFFFHGEDPLSLLPVHCISWFYQASEEYSSLIKTNHGQALGIA